MIIRKYQHTVIDVLVDIWYKTSVKAHYFIREEYWKSQIKEMKENYIPMSETYVVTRDLKIIGFISMLDNYLAALFIDIEYQGNGAGKKLLTFIKERRNIIQLKVYKENISAVQFYSRNGFVIKNEGTDHLTDQAEYLMEWKQSSNH